MMTEMEKTKMALEYVGKLAEGIDPLTDKPIEAGGVYDNTKLCRCFYYVADILKQVIANGGQVGKGGKAVYIYDKADVEKVRPLDGTLAVTKFIEYMQTQMEPEKGAIPYRAVTGWLLANGYLEERTHNGKPRKFASPKGIAHGITNMDVQGPNGNYTAIYYNKAAQQLILDNLKAMLERF